MTIVSLIFSKFSEVKQSFLKENLIFSKFYQVKQSFLKENLIFSVGKDSKRFKNIQKYSKRYRDHESPLGINCCALHNHDWAKPNNCFPYLFLRKRYRNHDYTNFIKKHPRIYRLVGNQTCKGYPISNAVVEKSIRTFKSHWKNLKMGLPKNVDKNSALQKFCNERIARAVY